MKNEIHELTLNFDLFCSFRCDETQEQSLEVRNLIENGRMFFKSFERKWGYDHE